MTIEEMARLIQEKNIRGKLKGLLLKEFPKDAKDAEDWVQRALMRTLKAAQYLKDADGITGYARESAIGIAIDEKEKAHERKRLLKGRPRHKRARDPMRHIDYKIDLERAVRRTVGERAIQAALWEIHYERATWDEVIADLPTSVTASGWRDRLWKANRALRQEMKRKGYGC